jgi:hypothetical protein
MKPLSKITVPLAMLSVPSTIALLVGCSMSRFGAATSDSERAM